MMNLIAKMSLGMKCLLGAVSAVLMTSFIFYFSIFGSLSNYCLKHSDQASANFGSFIGGIGSFIGGTIGIVISGLAFLGVWKTYQAQARQLDISIKQLDASKKDSLFLELQRIMLSTTEEIKSLFNSEPIHSDMSAYANYKTTLLSQLENLSAAQKSNSNEEIISKIKSSIEIDALRAKRKVEFICQVFDAYTKNGGEDSILLLYKKMINTEVHYLSCAIPLTNSYISKFFPTIGSNG